jgi:hypothetical protein
MRALAGCVAKRGRAVIPISLGRENVPNSSKEIQPPLGTTAESKSSFNPKADATSLARCIASIRRIVLG